jgi:hypothetical protein
VNFECLFNMVVVYLIILNLLSTQNCALNTICAMCIIHYVLCFVLSLVIILQGAYTNVAIGKIKLALCSWKHYSLK